MAVRFFTSDFHFGMTDILRFEGRPFSSIEKMNEAYLRSCNSRAKEDDTIIHLGDLASYKQDRGNVGLMQKPSELVKKLNATFVNVRGNHDLSNKVKSLCESLRLSLGKMYPDVSASHFPSYDSRAKDHFINGDIHLCGHVHREWKHCLDLTHQVLNINVGVDVWNHRIVSEEELIIYIGEVLKLPKSKLNKVVVNKNGTFRKV